MFRNGWSLDSQFGFCPKIFDCKILIYGDEWINPVLLGARKIFNLGNSNIFQKSLIFGTFSGGVSFSQLPDPPKKVPKINNFCGEILGIQEKTTKFEFLKLVIIWFVSVSTNQLSEYPNVHVSGATRIRKTEQLSLDWTGDTHWCRICHLVNVEKK